MSGGRHCLVGSAIGFVAFLLAGLYPALLNGGLAGRWLACHLVSGATDRMFVVKLLVMLGMIGAAVIGGVFFTSVGALIGTFMGIAAKYPPEARRD